MEQAKSILVIDDDPDVGNYCAAILEPLGYQVSRAVSAKDGEAMLTAKRPDLVILDVMMEQPDSGFMLAKIIARDYSGLPVIMLSSIAEASMQVFDVSDLPVSAFVEKPISSDDLLQGVRKLLP